MKKNSSIIESGQSTVEFLFAFIFSLGIFWGFISLALNYTSGYLVHYATFMSARAYLVADDGSNSGTYVYENARTYATKTFNAYGLQRFFVKNLKLDFNEIDGQRGFGGQGPSARKAKLFIGPFVSFNQSFFVSFISTIRQMNFVSEAFLGKEPTRYECHKRVCEIIEYRTNGAHKPCDSGDSSHATLFDNGC